MSALLSTLIFAATATASFTTNFLIPINYNNSPVPKSSLLGSVVAVDGNATTLAVKYDDRADCSSYRNNEEETWTFYGNTGFESDGTTTDEDVFGLSTAHVKCDMPSSYKGSATCTYSSNGQYLVSVHCSGASRYATCTPPVETRTVYYHTKDGPAEIEINTFTYNCPTSYPDAFYEFCKTGAGGSVLPEYVAAQTSTFVRQWIKEIEVDITAGEEKLGATAGATPANSEAKPTGTGEPRRPRNCDAESRTSAGPMLPTTTTAGAAHIRPVVPALAGLVVAMRAFIA